MVRLLKLALQGTSPGALETSHQYPQQHHGKVALCPKNATWLRRLKGYAGFILGLTASPWVISEQPAPVTESNVHWAYASYFGTGTYKMNDAQSVFVINTGIDWLSGDTPWLQVDAEPARYRVRLPITLGLASIDFGDVPEILDPGNLSLGGVGLGLDLDIPISTRWSLRPNLQLSHDRVLGTSHYAWTYRTDLRARYQHSFGTVNGSFIAAMGAVGFEPNRGEGDDFVFTELGAELEIPVKGFGDSHGQGRLYPFVKYTQLPVNIEVQKTATSTASTHNLIDFGVAFGRADRPLQWSFLELDRVGFAATFSTTSDVIGIKLVVESLYEP